MADLKFIGQYNMVACLEKTEENAEFHQIVDFLSTCSINYALTAVVISESLVRSDLLFNDEDGIACLTNDEILKHCNCWIYHLSIKTYFSKRKLVQVTDPGAKIPHWGGADAQTRPETASKMSRDPPLSEVNTSRCGEDSKEYHDDLMDCDPHTTPSFTSLRRVLSLEERKTAQDKVITRLKLRVKSLEKKRKAKTPQPMKRILFKGKVETSIDTNKGSGEKGGSTTNQVSTARPKVSAASVPVNVSAATPSTPPTTTTIFGAQKEKTKCKKKEELLVLNLAKVFDEIQSQNRLADHELTSKTKKEETRKKLYQKEQKWIDDFKPMDDDSQQQAKSTKMRPRADSEEESSKKQKLEEEDDAEKEELRASMDVVPRDDVAIDVESLATKYPIVDWKIHILNENMMYYQIIKADGSSKNYKIFSEMLDDFDRQDVIDLHRLVNERYETTSPEGYDLMLWGDLKTLFEPNEEDEIWRNQ
ncbi:hypothetical protein Tco_0093390 [Tanacetum coccineum]